MTEMPGSRPDSDPKPIRLPGSAFWNVFRTFGKDEAIALVISTAGTALASPFVSSALALAFVGPVVEKIGFYPWHVWEAVKLYRATPREERRTLSYYVKEALGGGTNSLAWDICVHDPSHILLMWGGLTLYPAVPAWLMSIVAFLAAVVIVAWLQVGVAEARYALLKRRMLRAGFEIDTYLEARFYIRWGYSADKAQEVLARGLGLHFVERLRYYDIYFRNDLPKLSGRAPVVRFRKRTFGKSSARWRNKEKMVAIGFAQTAQAIFTHPQEEQKGGVDQFRFFSVGKDKFFFPIDEEAMPERIEDLKDGRIRRLLRGGLEWKRVSFERTIMLDATDALYVGVDALPGGQDGCVIELKVRLGKKEKDLFLAAMRWVMLNMPVTHTTLQKTELELF